jgi:hypothetical protein
MSVHTVSSSMPETPPKGLHKRADAFLDFNDGGYSQTWHCVEYPEIRWGVHAPDRKTTPTRTYSVKGVAAGFKTFQEAWTALRNRSDDPKP